MKPTWTRNRSVLAVALVLVAGACARKPPQPQPQGPTIEITSPGKTSTKGNVVALDLSVSGVEIVKPDGDTSGKTGHYHVFINRVPVQVGEVIPKEAGIVHSAEDPVIIYGLPVGEHRLTAVIGDGSHRRIGETSAVTRVKVEGPSLDASAPATSPAGQPVTVEVKVEGVQLIKAAEDSSGKAGTQGHLHVFADQTPLPPGQPYPPKDQAGPIHTADSMVGLTGLAPGEHTIWVVLGYADHTPFDPPVADKVTVTVQ